MRTAVLLAALLFALNASAAVYKCPSDDGKVEYRDHPCEQGTKLITEFNSIDTAPNPEVEKAVREFNARVERRENEQRQRDASWNAFRQQCQDYLDQASRQQPWLDSKSRVARGSAATEIAIQWRKYKDAGCY